MNDRNAFLHGQTAPIRDDAPPPEQGWRGERAADEPTDGQQQRRIPGLSAPVEEVSGTAYAEAQGLHGEEGKDSEEPGKDGASGAEDKSLAPQSDRGAEAPDGVNDLDMSADSPGGESAGAPYPHGHRKPHNDPGSIMGHGGQSEIDYHGTGHLGKTDAGDDDDRNGVTKNED